MNKKGMGFKTLLGLALAVPSFFILLTLGSMILDLLMPDEGIDPASMKNFERLKHEVNLLIEDEKDYSTSEVVFQISKDKMLIGYDREVDDDEQMVDVGFFDYRDVIGSGRKVNGKNANKECPSSSCLCLGKNDKGILKCDSLNESVIFLGYDGGNNKYGKDRDLNIPDSLETSSLEPSSYLAVTKQERIRKLFVEKSIIDDKIYIYMAPKKKGEEGLSDKEVTQRKSNMRKNLGINPRSN